MCHALLISVSKLRASGPRAPEVSMAIGTKWWDLDSRALDLFLLQYLATIFFLVCFNVLILTDAIMKINLTL